MKCPKCGDEKIQIISNVFTKEKKLSLLSAIFMFSSTILIIFGILFYTDGTSTIATNGIENLILKYIDKQIAITLITSGASFFIMGVMIQLFMPYKIKTTFHAFCTNCAYIWSPQENKNLWITEETKQTNTTE